MELPNNYLIFAAEVFFTTLGLLIALIYFYIKSARKWQLHIHDIQDELLAYRNKYLEEKERADIIREIINSQNKQLEKVNIELTDTKKIGETLLTKITTLKEEIEELHQSEKLRSGVANQLVKSKIENEHLTAAVAEHQKTITELKETINNLEHEINELKNQTQSIDTTEQNHDLQTTGEINFERLQKRADKQAETIRELELELMRVGYKKPSKETEDAEDAEDATKTHDLERMLNESETCVKLLESELTELQNKVRTFEEEAQANQNVPQNNGDIQQLEQMLNESETCNTLLETELESLMQKIRVLEGKEEPPEPPPQNYDI